jgi:hypothetical protein
LTRLSRLTWDEIWTRLGQEVAKRAEYVCYRAGLSRSPSGVPLGTRASGNFFFPPNQIPARAELLKRHLPATVQQTIVEANEILQHHFRLLGYQDLDYGSEIDWRLDAVHGKRAPLKPWYKIHFLDFAEVGDHKVTWELNRHQHLVTLAKAWVFTGEGKYLEEISRQFYSWQSANPYPIGINWGSSLEVAFRSLSWLWVRALTGHTQTQNSGKASPLPESFDRDLLRALARNGRYIERYLSTYFSPNTHLIGEAVALFFIGTLCPQIPSAPRWPQKGLAIVLAEAERQVRPDGVYFEQSLYYHVYALDFFLHTRVLAERNGIATPKAFDEVLEKMLEVVRVLSRNGPPQGFGDDDGGRLFDPRRNQTEHMADPLALGAALYEYETDPLRKAATLTEESIWLFGESALNAGGHVRPELLSEAFEDGGLYVIASRGHVDAQMLIDAGPHGVGNGGHGHADALSVRLSLNQRSWLVDAGTHVYISSQAGPKDQIKNPAEDHERNRFRGTAAHNTLRVDGLDQAIPKGPFAWNTLPNVRAEQWITGSGFTLFSGNHDGYAKLPDHPVVHLRTIFHLHGEYFLTRDLVEGQGVHDLEIFWHFAPGLKLRASGNTLVAESDGGLSDEPQQLTLLTAGSAKWEVSAEDGLISPAYGALQSAPVGVFKVKTSMPVEIAALLIPLRTGARDSKFRLASSQASDPTAYIYESGEITDYVIFGKPGDSWSFSQFRGDGSLLFVRTQGTEIISLIFCSATFVEIDGKRVFSSPELVSKFEWTRAEGVAASNPASPKFFYEEALRPGTTVP